MPTIALLGTAAVSHATTLYTVTVGGIDFNAGGLATSPMLDIESVEVEEQGPGGVSSFQCTLFDPTAMITEPDNGYVEFWDDTNGWPLFAGFVQSWESTTHAVGRYISIDCIGIETLLDWAVLPRDFVLQDTAYDTLTIGDIVQVLAANVTGLGVSLNTAKATSGPGDADHPIGRMQSGEVGPLVGQSSIVLAGGTTLREALRTISEWPIQFADPRNFLATIDFRRGLRAWYQFSDLFSAGLDFPPYPDDYPILIINEAGFDQRTTILEYVKDRASEYAGVVVTGSSAAIQTVISSGSGRAGPMGTLNDSSITTIAEAVEAGKAWLATKVEGTRGSVSIDSWLPDAEYRAGGHVIVVNTQAGVDDEFIISSIKKRFVKAQGGVRETWLVSYGNLPPSAMRDVRRLT